jgi:hypothetical protein
MVTNGQQSQDRTAQLAGELGIVADWQQWLDEFGADEVTAALVQLDIETLPFMGGVS